MEDTPVFRELEAAGDATPTSLLSPCSPSAALSMHQRRTRGS